MIVVMHIIKQFGARNGTITAPNSSELSWDNITMESMYMKGFFEVLFWATVFGYSIYFLVGGFIHVSWFLLSIDIDSIQ